MHETAHLIAEGHQAGPVGDASQFTDEVQREYATVLAILLTGRMDAADVQRHAAAREVRVLSRKDGGDERFVRGAVEGEFGVDQAVGVVEHGVGVAHRRLAASSWSWSPGRLSGADWARKRE